MIVYFLNGNRGTNWSLLNCMFEFSCTAHPDYTATAHGQHDPFLPLVTISSRDAVHEHMPSIYIYTFKMSLEKKLT